MSYDDSELTKKTVKAVLLEANMPTDRFARQFCQPIGPSSVARLLNTAQPLTSFHIRTLLFAAGRLARVDPRRLFAAFEQKIRPELLPELELAIAQIKSAGTAELLEIMKEIDDAETTCSEVLIYSRYPRLVLLDDDVAHAVVRFWAKRYSSNRRIAQQLLQETASARRELLMAGPPKEDRRTIDVVPLSGWQRIAQRLTPFTVCTSEQIGASLNSVLHDYILAGRTELIIIDDLQNTDARLWMAEYRKFHSVVTFDSKLLVKRRKRTLACRILKDIDGPNAQRIIEHHRAHLAVAASAACHPLTRIGTAQFFMQFMRDNGYRPFW